VKYHHLQPLSYCWKYFKKYLIYHLDLH
jgi:hypothetical protein